MKFSKRSLEERPVMTKTLFVAVVTGANRGLGLETCRQLARRGIKVVLTSRSEKKGRLAVQSLRAEKLEVDFHRLDVTVPESVLSLADYVKSTYRRLDILVNNAGIMLTHRDSQNKFEPSILKTDIDTVHQSMETNTYGPMRVTQALVPLMEGRGNVVNVSSGMGQLAEMNGGWPGYRLSKTALNALTRIFADELKNTRIKVNSVCPGWVRTDMGGSNADRSVEQGAETIVWLATLPEDGSTGGFYRDKKLISW